MKNKQFDDTFELYDLRVEVLQGDKPLVCYHKIGDYFDISGENIIMPANQSFSMYALSALLPLLPAKQRMTDENDWMTTDTDIACPDPNCGGIFRITRTGKRTFRHSEVTLVPLNKNERTIHRKTNRNSRKNPSTTA